MPTKPDGALGSLDYTKEERRALAIKSRLSAPKFGNAERQALIDEVWCPSALLITSLVSVCTSFKCVFGIMSNFTTGYDENLF
jgi:hypothetical protein